MELELEQVESLCVMSQARRTVIDLMLKDGKTMYMRETPDQVRLRYPDAVVMPIDEATSILESLCIDKHVAVISEESYWDAFECLPPFKSTRRNGNHSFMMSEFFYGNITSIYAHVDGKYFTFRDKCTTSHEDIIKKCQQAFVPVDPMTVDCDCV